MSIKLRKQSATAVTVPDGLYVQLFVDVDGQPKIMDSSGTVIPLAQASTLTLVEQGTAPSGEATKFKLYAQDVGGNVELFAIDSSSNDIQMTSNGALLAAAGPATQLQTLGSPVTVGSAAPPSVGQVLTATSATAASWQDPSVGGGSSLTQELAVQHADFTAVANTSYYIAVGDGTPKLVTLPATPADGDRVELSAVGSGSDLIGISGNGNSVYWGGFDFEPTPYVVKGVGFHALLRWTAATTSWTNVADDVVSLFGGGGGVTGNAIPVSSDTGQPTAYQLSANSLIARVGNFVQPLQLPTYSILARPGTGDISPPVLSANTVFGRLSSNDLGGIYDQRIVLTSNVLVTNTAADVTAFTFQIPTALDWYVYELHLTIDQTVATSTIGFAITLGATSFTQNVAFVRSPTDINFGNANTAGGFVYEASDRPIGRYETTITGGFRKDGSVGTLVLRARSGAGTTYILPGSWGRVWKGFAV